VASVKGGRRSKQEQAIQCPRSCSRLLNDSEFAGFEGKWRLVGTCPPGISLLSDWMPAVLRRLELLQKVLNPYI
jgi:hypothetical protein